MNCPYCDEKTTVTDTAAASDKVIRVRKCKKCGIRFKTMEQRDDSGATRAEFIKLRKG